MNLKLWRCKACKTIFAQEVDDRGAVCVACGRLEVDGHVEECKEYSLIKHTREEE